MKLKGENDMTTMEPVSLTERTESYTMEELNARLDEAEAADEADKLVTHEEVMQKAYEYLAAL